MEKNIYIFKISKPSGDFTVRHVGIIPDINGRHFAANFTSLPLRWRTAPCANMCNKCVLIHIMLGKPPAQISQYDNKDYCVYLEWIPILSSFKIKILLRLKRIAFWKCINKQHKVLSGCTEMTLLLCYAWTRNSTMKHLALKFKQL